MAQAPSGSDGVRECERETGAETYAVAVLGDAFDFEGLAARAARRLPPHLLVDHLVLGLGAQRTARRRVAVAQRREELVDADATRLALGARLLERVRYERQLGAVRRELCASVQ